MDYPQRFEIRFDPDAAREYKNLDKSIRSIVNKRLEELEYRADEIGKPLGNMRNIALSGCKELKLKSIGYLIIFRINHDAIEILRVVQIIAIDQRVDSMVFKVANKRYARLKASPSAQSLRRWQDMKRN